jgi:hypothetical protein
MLTVQIETLGDLAVVECEGRIVRSEAAFELRKGVNSQSDARIIVLDLSEVSAIEGGGLGMLVFLQRWLTTMTFDSRCSIPAHLCGIGWSTLARCERSTLLRSTK